MSAVPNADWSLTEAEIRRKVVELLDNCNMTRLNLWMSSGIIAGVLDSDLVGVALLEEMPRRSQHVREYWLDQPCTCQGHPN